MSDTDTRSKHAMSDTDSGDISGMSFSRLSGLSKPVSKMVYSIKSLTTVDDASVVLDCVWSSGCNSFECPAQKPEEQKLLGQWIRDSAVPREDVVLIITGDVIDDLASSCERLGVHHADVFILDGATIYGASNGASNHLNHLITTAVDQLSEIAGESNGNKRTCVYGLSNFPRSHMLRDAVTYAATTDKQAPICDLVEGSLVEPTQTMFHTGNTVTDEKRELYAQLPHMAVIARNTLAGGFLCGEVGEDGKSVQWKDLHANGAYFKAENFARRARAATLADSKGVSPSQIGVAYMLNQPYTSFAVMGTTNLDRIRQNAGATKIVLSPAEIRFLDAGTTPQVKTRALVTPQCILEEQPLSAKAAFTVFKAREEIARILDGKDDRAIAITGPCSIHDPEAAIEYARELKKYADEHKDTLCVVMRVYFEKPRTTVGWKGLTSDPDLNGTCDMNKGLRVCRQVLMEINEMGLPCATELLSNMTPPYFSDLISWAAIGARTTESQIHREMVSSLSEIPVGFKNGTQGNVDIALDAIQSSQGVHTFLNVGPDGAAAMVTSQGNPHGHLVLRGGKDGPNFSAPHIQSVIMAQGKKNIRKRIIVDCSHGNSNKDHKNQPKVSRDIAQQMSEGSSMIGGVMIESNLVEGAQKLDPGKTDLRTLKRGLSVTDACVDLPTTKDMFVDLSQGVKRRRLCLKQ